VRVDLMN